MRMSTLVSAFLVLALSLTASASEHPENIGNNCDDLLSQEFEWAKSIYLEVQARMDRAETKNEAMDHFNTMWAWMEESSLVEDETRIIQAADWLLYPSPNVRKMAIYVLGRATSYPYKALYRVVQSLKYPWNIHLNEESAEYGLLKALRDHCAENLQVEGSAYWVKLFQGLLETRNGSPERLAAIEEVLAELRMNFPEQP